MITIETIKRPDGPSVVPAAGRPWRFAAMALLAALAARWMAAAERRRQRLDLLDLTDDQLRDIGLTRSQARREANRSSFD
jgi:uncharacterized protein YjiS (DUF1127 family)